MPLAAHLNKRDILSSPSCCFVLLLLFLLLLKSTWQSKAAFAALLLLLCGIFIVLIELVGAEENICNKFHFISVHFILCSSPNSTFGFSHFSSIWFNYISLLFLQIELSGNSRCLLYDWIFCLLVYFLACKNYANIFSFRMDFYLIYAF